MAEHSLRRWITRPIDCKTLNIRYPKGNWLFDRPMPDFSSYLESVQQHYSKLQGFYTPTDAVLPLKVQSVEKVDRLSKEGGNDRQPSQKNEQFLVLDGLRKYALGDDREHVLLAGRPGSGKSMALQQLSVALAKEGQIAVLVQLKGNVPLLKAIADEFENGDLEFDEKEIKRLLRHQKLVLLLDGINETSDELRKTLQPFRERYRATPMIFTTRDLAIGGDLGIGKRFEMKPLSPEQLREFVGKYLPGQGERLLEQLRDRLKEISETPLLLKMLCEVFDPETDQIPQNKGELFREFDRKYEQFKGLPAVSPDFRRFKSEVLQHLAFVMMTGNEGKPIELELTIERGKVEKAIENLVVGRVSDPGAKAKEWLEDLLEHHLLQVATDDRRVEFRHQLFQEYYAAEDLMGDRQRLLEWLSILPNHEYSLFQQDYLNYQKWTEPIALLGLCEEDTAIPIVEQALNVDLMLGTRLAGEVRSEYRDKALVVIPETPYWIKTELSSNSRSKTNSVRKNSLAKKSPHILSESSNVRRNFNLNEIVARLKGTVDRGLFRHDFDDLIQCDRELALSALQEILDENDPNGQCYALEAVGRHKLKEFVPVLIDLLEIDLLQKKGLALIIIRLLNFFPSQEVEHKFLEILKDAQCDYIHSNIIKILGKHKSQLSVSLLMNILDNHQDEDLRNASLLSLSEIGIREVLPTLQYRLRREIDAELNVNRKNNLFVLELDREYHFSSLRVARLTEMSDHQFKNIRVLTKSIALIGEGECLPLLREALHTFSHVTNLSKEISSAMRAIQFKYEFYNYEIQQQAEELREADRTSLEGDRGDRSVTQNFYAPVYGVAGNVEGNQIISPPQIC